MDEGWARALSQMGYRSEADREHLQQDELTDTQAAAARREADDRDNAGIDHEPPDRSTHAVSIYRRAFHTLPSQFAVELGLICLDALEHVAVRWSA
jgi:hypothetical protein